MVLALTWTGWSGLLATVGVILAVVGAARMAGRRPRGAAGLPGACRARGRDHGRPRRLAGLPRGATAAPCRGRSRWTRSIDSWARIRAGRPRPRPRGARSSPPWPSRCAPASAARRRMTPGRCAAPPEPGNRCPAGSVSPRDVGPPRPSRRPDPSRQPPADGALDARHRDGRGVDVGGARARRRCRSLRPPPHRGRRAAEHPPVGQDVRSHRRRARAAVGASAVHDGGRRCAGGRARARRRRHAESARPSSAGARRPKRRPPRRRSSTRPWRTAWPSPAPSSRSWCRRDGRSTGPTWPVRRPWPWYRRRWPGWSRPCRRRPSARTSSSGRGACASSACCPIAPAATSRW